MELKLLVIGRHADIMDKILDLLRQQGYDAIGAFTNEHAIDLFRTMKIDVVIIGGGVDLESRTFFYKEFALINPLAKIMVAHPQTILSDLKEIIKGINE